MKLISNKTKKSVFYYCDFISGELLKSADGGTIYVQQVKNLTNKIEVTLKPLSKWWFVQIIQVFIYRIKY